MVQKKVTQVVLPIVERRAFSELVKDYQSLSSKVHVLQARKQSILNDYLEESKRYFFGDLSKLTMKSSMKKTNDHVKKIDKEIDRLVIQAEKIVQKTLAMLKADSAAPHKATLTGVSKLTKGRVKR